MDILAVSQNIDKGLILSGHISYGSLVHIAGTVSYKKNAECYFNWGRTHQVIDARISKWPLDSKIKTGISHKTVVKIEKLHPKAYFSQEVRL